MSNKFDRFTKKARQVLTYAQEEAQLMNHGYIGTEHLLLGLVREQTGIPAKVLHDLGVDLQKTREIVEEMVGKGKRGQFGRVSLTPRTKAGRGLGPGTPGLKRSGKLHQTISSALGIVCVGK